MIVDVHSHVPSHIDTVPPEEEISSSIIRPDRAIRMTNSYDDFFEAMKPVDRVISFGIAMPADRPAVLGKYKDAKSYREPCKECIRTSFTTGQTKWVEE